MAAGDRRGLRLGHLLPIIATGLALPAAGQDAPAPEEGFVLDTITVEGARLGLGATASEGTGRFTPEVTGTATGFVLTPRETPQTVVVVTDQIIRDFHLTDVKDVLEAAPGVYVETERNAGFYDYFARGHELQAQVDGLPTTRRIGDRGGVSMDTAILDRVEVVQGASGLLTGAGEPGGTVNFVRKMPTAFRQVLGEASADSEGGYRLMGDVSGPLNAEGTIRGRAVVAFDDSRSFIDEVWDRKLLGHLVVEADVTDRTLVAAGASWDDIEASDGATYGWPTYHDGTFLGIPRSRNLGAEWARNRGNAESYFVKLDQELGGGWRLLGELNQTHIARSFTESSTDFSVDPATGEGAGIWGARESWTNDITALDFYATGPFELLGRSHELMAGFSGNRTTHHSAGYSETIDAVEWINVYDHDPNDVPGPDSLPYVEYTAPFETVTTQYGGYLAGRFSLVDPLHLIAGGRLTWYEQEQDGAKVADESAEFTPYAGLVYDFSAWGSVYASYSQVFQPNTIDTPTASGGVLPPEEGTNLEAGIKAAFFDGALDAYAAVFRLEQTNLPQVDVTVRPGTCGVTDCYVASGEVVTEGIDIGLAGEVRPGWNVFGGYTYLDPRTSDGDAWDTETPRNLLKASTTWDLPGDRWTIGGGVNWRSGIYAEGDHWFIEGQRWKIEQGDVFLLDLMAKYRVTDHASLLLTVENLFDEEYYSSISLPWHGNVVGPPRTATLTLSAAF